MRHQLAALSFALLFCAQACSDASDSLVGGAGGDNGGAGAAGIPGAGGTGGRAGVSGGGGTAGGGGGTAGEGGASAPARVRDTLPGDGDEEVALDTAIVVELDSSFDPVALLSVEVRVRDEFGALISGRISTDVEASRVVFLPDEPPALARQYTARVNLGHVDDDDANDDESFYRWGFETRDGQWSETLDIGGGCSGQHGEPRVVMTADGAAAMAWIARAARFYICSRRFHPVYGWSEPFPHPRPDPEVPGSTSNISLGIDADLNVIIASRQTVGNVDIFAERFDAMLGEWGPASRLEFSDGGTNPPELVVDTQGNATAVWQQYDGDSLPIRLSRYSVDTGWSSPVVLSDDDVVRSPSLAVDPRGGVLMAASQFCVVRCITTRSFAEGFGWTAATPVNPGATSYSERPVIAVNGVGEAALAWHQAETNSFPVQERVPSDIWVSTLSPFFGWAAPELLEFDPGEVSPPHIAIDEFGNAIAVWGQYFVANNGVMASRFTPGDGWGPREMISEPHESEPRLVRVAIDPTGKAIAVWEQLSDTRQVWFNRFTPRRGWESAELVQSGLAGSIETEPQIAIDAKGRAFMVWVTSGGRARARRFE